MAEMEEIAVLIDNGVLTLGFNRPEKRNAITGAMYAELADQLNAAADNDEVGAVLIYGEGDDFTAGNDINDFLNNPPSGDNSNAPVWRFLIAIREFPKPIVASITGRAVGIGTTLLMHCDYVIAGRGTKLSMPFVNLGLVPEAASSYLLPIIMGHQRASELLLLGDVFSAEKAREYGLINEVVSDEESPVRGGEVAKQLADQPRNAIRQAKRLIKKAHSQAVAQTMVEEGKLFQEALVSDEARDAFMNFISKKGK
ncbi:enoyl-CoA hydratase [Actinomycetes bacterium]|nr:enoyl-CoA hydratase [Actinomycetes bacterium]